MRGIKVVDEGEHTLELLSDSLMFFQFYIFGTNQSQGINSVYVFFLNICLSISSPSALR